jgi:hypothetical protein
VTPFRALAAVHLQSTWNRMRKQMGTTGLWAFLILIGFIALFSIAPMMIGLGAMGYLVGAQLDGPEADRALPIAAFAYTLLTLFAGLVGGISSGSRQLPWETLHVFPVRDTTLFRAELFAGAGEAITFVELLALLVVCVGASIGAPVATPLFGLLFVTHAVALLALQQLAGSIAQRLSRRLRAMLIFLPVAAITLPSLLPLIIKRTDRASFESWGDRLAAVTRWLPARAVLESARALVKGELSLASLAWATVVPVVLVLLIVVIAYQFVAREKPLTIDTATGKPAKLWTFASQTLGIARLTWESLSQSLPGRFGLVMPLITIVLIRGPLAEILPGRGWTAPIAFGYAALAGTNLLFNQFGLDRHGVKVLFLLPLEPMAMLRGKLLGFAAWQGLQAGLLLVLLALTGHRDPIELLVGLLLYACVFLILAMVGQFASIWQPRPLRKNGLRASQPPLLVVMMMFGTLITAGGLLYGVTFGVRTFFPGWELPVLLGIGGLLTAMVFPVLAFNALFLERNREKLVEVLGSAG